MIEKVAIPDELKILNPEFQRQVVVVGTEGYWLYPLPEYMAELVSSVLADVLRDIYTADMKCPLCGAAYKNALGRSKNCSSDGCGEILVSCQISPMAALMKENRATNMIAKILELSDEEIRKMTFPQIQHFAGVLWKQNFDDSVTLPKESKQNFLEVLKWIGLGPVLGQSQELPQSEKSTSPSLPNTDIQGSISEDAGKVANL